MLIDVIIEVIVKVGYDFVGLVLCIDVLVN